MLTALSNENIGRKECNYKMHEWQSLALYVLNSVKRFSGTKKQYENKERVGFLKAILQYRISSWMFDEISKHQRISGSSL